MDDQIEDVQLRVLMPATWAEWFARVERTAKAAHLPYSAFYPPNPAIVAKLGPIPAPPKRWKDTP